MSGSVLVQGVLEQCKMRIPECIHSGLEISVL